MFYIKTRGPDQSTEKHTFSESRQLFLNEVELEKHSTCPFGEEAIKAGVLDFRCFNWQELR